MENRKDNSGVLFKNDRKENERAPDYKGNITVDGKDYLIMKEADLFAVFTK